MSFCFIISHTGGITAEIRTKTAPKTSIQLFFPGSMPLKTVYCAIIRKKICIEMAMLNQMAVVIKSPCKLMIKEPAVAKEWHNTSRTLPASVGKAKSLCSVMRDKIRGTIIETIAVQNMIASTLPVLSLIFWMTEFIAPESPQSVMKTYPRTAPPVDTYVSAPSVGAIVKFCKVFSKS